MGLFGKKEVCPVCGKKIKGDVLIKIQGNVSLCKDCSSKVNMDTAMIPNQTPEDIKAHLAYRERNQLRYDEFESTLELKIGASIFRVDEVQKTWFCNSNKRDKNPPVFGYEEILKYEYLENGVPYVEEEKKSGLGALFSKKEPVMVKSMKLHMELSNKYTPVLDVELMKLNDEIKSNSLSYKSNKRAIDKVLAAIAGMKGLGDLGSIESDDVQDVAEDVVDAAEDAADVAEDVMDEAVDVAEDAMDEAADVAEDAVDEAADVAEGAIEDATDAAGDVADAAEDAIETVEESIPEADVEVESAPVGGFSLPVGVVYGEDK